MQSDFIIFQCESQAISTYEQCLGGGGYKWSIIFLPAAVYEQSQDKNE